jgi:hypothetical protein
LSSLRSDILGWGVKENKMSGLRPRHFLFRGMMQGLSSLRSDILGWGVKENKMSGSALAILRWNEEGIVLASLGHPGVGRQGK